MFPPGHIGGALVMSAPFVRVLGPRQSLWFAAFAVFGGRLPDIDTTLPIPHHGITHTIIFVVASSLVLGIVAAAIVEWYPPAAVATATLSLSSRTVFVLTVGGLFVGGISHIILDILSVGTAIANPKPLHPLWPLHSRRVGLALIPVRAAYTNFGLLAIGAIVFIAVYLAVHDPPLMQKIRKWADV